MGVIYNRTQLSSDIATMVSTADYSTNIQVVANNAVRQVLSDVDLRSTKRRTALTPSLFENIYDYAAPASLKGNKIIDIEPQINRTQFDDWQLTSGEEFDRRKQTGTDGLIAVVDYDMTKRIRVSLPIDEESITVNEMNAVDSWLLFGDGTNLTTDTSNFVNGSASINWDISSAGGTTAGIYNASLDTFDISDYLTTGSAFVWVYISSTTNLTNFILRIGSDSSNYYYITITTGNEGLAFVAGWNLLRFDFANKATTGTPDDDACDYVALYMTKAGAKISETDYRFNNLMIGNGEHYNVIYYSRYLWQSSAGVYLENSTATGDYLNCEADEYQLFLYKTASLTELDAHNFERANALELEYQRKLGQYKQQYASEAIGMSSSTWNKTY